MAGMVRDDVNLGSLNGLIDRLLGITLNNKEFHTILSRLSRVMPILRPLQPDRYAVRRKVRVDQPASRGREVSTSPNCA